MVVNEIAVADPGNGFSFGVLAPPTFRDPKAMLLTGGRPPTTPGFDVCGAFGILCTAGGDCVLRGLQSVTNPSP